MFSKESKRSTNEKKKHLILKGQLTRPTPAEQQRLSQETALVDLIVISRNFILYQINQTYCHSGRTQTVLFVLL